MDTHDLRNIFIESIAVFGRTMVLGQLYTQVISSNNGTMK